MRVIPAIDIIDGKVTRLTEGIYHSQVFYEETIHNAALKFKELGFKRIHLVDLLGSRDGKLNITDIISDIKNTTNIELQIGGGIRTLNDAKKMLNAGADYLIIGSLSIVNKEVLINISKNIGSDKIIVSSDVKNSTVRINGWTTDSKITIQTHINNCRVAGINNFLVTDISKDGKLEGPSIELYKNIILNNPDINLIASGGVSCANDLYLLENSGIKNVVVGKAIYEKKISDKELKNFVN